MNMFDNLRNQANSSAFEDEAQFQSAEGSNAAPRRAPGRFLGMSPMQRFVIVFMLMILVCTVGAMFLLVTGKIGLF
jgi:ABC-type Na+ efflux pump permease subunit